MSFGINGGGFLARLGADVELDPVNNRAKLRCAIQMDKEYTEWVSVLVNGPKSGNLDWLGKGRKGDEVAFIATRLVTKPKVPGDDKAGVWINITASSMDIRLIPKAAKAPAGDDEIPF